MYFRNIKNKIFLAPMEEVNDIVFRILCKKSGAGLTWTPLTNPLTKQRQFLEDKPILQLFGGKELCEFSRRHIKNSPFRTLRKGASGKPAGFPICTNTKGIKEFMKKYDKKVSGWDFNLGCPATTARKHGFGSYLTDLKAIEKILKTMRENTKKFLCVKIRKSSLAFDILKIAEKYCNAICIHPRTRKQGYSGEPDIKFAEKFKAKSKIPVIYSGDVNETNYKELLKKFDAVMVGRKAIGNPNIFAKLTNKKLKQITFQDYLALLRKKKYALPFRQIKFQAMQFTKGKRNSRKIRDKLSKIKTFEELKNYLKIKLQ